MREKGWRKKSRLAQDRKHISWQLSSGERTEPSELVPFAELRRIKLSRPELLYRSSPAVEAPVSWSPLPFSIETL